MKDGSTIDALPVLGIFEFDDNGKICSWREYWDLQDWVARGGPALQVLNNRSFAAGMEGIEKQTLSGPH